MLASRARRLAARLKGFGDGSKELNSEALQSFKKDVAQASQKNTDALLKFKAAGVQVQAAQEKLNDATQKYGADSTQAQAAAIRLQQAELKQQTAADTLKASTENLKGAKERLKNLEAELAAQSSKSATGFGAAANAFKTGFRPSVPVFPGLCRGFSGRLCREIDWLGRKVGWWGVHRRDDGHTWRFRRRQVGRVRNRRSCQGRFRTHVGWSAGRGKVHRLRFWQWVRLYRQDCR